MLLCLQSLYSREAKLSPLMKARADIYASPFRQKKFADEEGGQKHTLPPPLDNVWDVAWFRKRISIKMYEIWIFDYRQIVHGNFFQVPLNTIKCAYTLHFQNGKVAERKRDSQNTPVALSDLHISAAPQKRTTIYNNRAQNGSAQVTT